MSWVSEIFAGGTAGVLQGAGSFAKDIREAITGKTITDPGVMAEIALKAEQLKLAAEQAQLNYTVEMSKAQTAINQVEAANTSLFVSGWRPAVGWCCVLGLAYVFLLKPLLPWTVGVISAIIGHPTAIAAMPEVPMGDLIVLLGGMLGLGVMRSVDKYNRVTGISPGDKGNS